MADGRGSGRGAFTESAPRPERGWLLILVVTLAAMLGSGCASRDPRVGAEQVVDQGLASFYSDALQGNRTASGERFDQKKLTAAHPDLPFGTWVRVQHLETGREVVVRINDRGPFIKGRVIDLSRRAAEQLGMVNAGLAPVRVVLE
jgi:rare lipoprotein A